MIKAGMCSVTLATCSVEELIATVKQAGLMAIEWGGKDHVPVGFTIESACYKLNMDLSQSLTFPFWKKGTFEYHFNY